MEFKIEIPEEYINKLIEDRLSKITPKYGQKKQAPEQEPIETAGPLFQVILDAAKRIPKDSEKRTGIRFKIKGETVETSLNNTTKNEAAEILSKYGMTVSRFCHAALEIILAEEKALQGKKKG